MIINTRALLRDYIKGVLGEPIITVEVTPFQIDAAIDIAIQKFSDYAAGGEITKLILLDIIPGVSTYKLDNKTKAVTMVKLKSSGLTYSFPGNLVITADQFFAGGVLPQGGIDIASVAAMQGKIDLLSNYFDTQPEWSFNDNSKELVFYDDPSKMSGSTKMLVQVMMEYIPEEVDMVYNHQFIKDYSVAKVKFQWGSNVGKFDASLINGSKINYDRILTEATAEITKLDLELIQKWAGPIGIFR